MADPFAPDAERSAFYARLAYGAGIALALLAVILTFAYERTHPSTTVGWVGVIALPVVTLAFAAASEVALRDGSRAAARWALALATLAVLGTFYAMFTRGILYTVPWAMALSGSVVLALQALEERGIRAP